MAQAFDLCSAAQQVHPMWCLAQFWKVQFWKVSGLQAGRPVPPTLKERKLSLRHHAHHSCWPWLPPCSLMACLDSQALASADGSAPQLAHPLLSRSLKPPMRGRSSKPLLLPLSRLSGSCGRRSRPQLSDWSALEGPVSSSSAPPPLRSASSKLRSLQGTALCLAQQLQNVIASLLAGILHALVI